jgi:hypothetical protein
MALAPFPSDILENEKDEAVRFTYRYIQTGSWHSIIAGRIQPSSRRDLHSALNTMQSHWSLILAIAPVYDQTGRSTLWSTASYYVGI